MRLCRRGNTIGGYSTPGRDALRRASDPRGSLRTDGEQAVPAQKEAPCSKDLPTALPKSTVPT